MDQSLGDRASPGHHWKGSPALLLDPLECPVQAMMALVFQWHPPISFLFNSLSERVFAALGIFYPQS